MAEYQFPDDLGFRVAAARIADAVQVAINSGVRLRPAGSERMLWTDRCPLGCVNLRHQDTHPIGRPAAELGIYYNDACAFADGFDGNTGRSRMTPHGHEDFYQLGLAYRRRFVEGAK
jgi:hypothetical protein